MLSHNFGTPEIDLYTSRVNKKLDVMHHESQTHILPSWIPCSSLEVINSSIYFLLLKLQKECHRTLLIAPRLSTQSWFPTLVQLAVALSVEMSSSYLILPGTSGKHPVGLKLHLTVVLCSNFSGNKLDFRGHSRHLLSSLEAEHRKIWQSC